MDLKEYFGSRHGIGILSTADAKGRVDAAVPARLPEGVKSRPRP